MIKINRIVGISGCRSSGYPKPWVIYSFVQSLPQDHTCMVVTGGTTGVDHIAIQAARSLGMPYMVIPYYSELGSSGGKARNETLVDFVHELYAFWNLTSPGTKHAIEIARKCGKLRDVYGPTGEILDMISIEDVLVSTAKRVESPRRLSRD